MVLACRRIKLYLQSHRFLLVVGVAIAFLLTFSAYGTASQASQRVLEGARIESGGKFTGSGYVSMAVLYVSFAFFNWFAPLIVDQINPKFGMFIGAIGYLFYLASFIKPMNWSLYLSSVIIGCGAAVLWTSSGVYITLCSDTLTLNKNFGYFWAIFQSSNLIGSIYTYVHLTDVVSITSDVRIPMYSIFLVVCASGCCVFLFLPMPTVEGRPLISPGSISVEEQECLMDSKSLIHSTRPNEHRANFGSLLLKTMKQSFVILKSRRMLSILVASAFTGLFSTFYSGVYGTCLSHMIFFGSKANSYIGLAGIFIGIGSILGGQLHTLLRPPKSEFLIIIGLIAGVVAQFLSFLFIPADAPFQVSTKDAYITPSVYLAMFVAFLLGLTDSIWNTQIFSLIGHIYPSTGPYTAVAFALFKFVQSLAAAIAYFYSTQLTLEWQFSILTVFVFCSYFAITTSQFKNLNSVTLIE